MKYSLTVCLLVVYVSLGWGADAGPRPKGLVVHEWGVFRVNTDVDFANADLRAEWDDLPGFVYGHIKGRVVPQHWGAVEIRKRPIIFFHADQPMQVRVRVDFPGGQAGVWYPATYSPAVEGLAKQPKVGNSLEWMLGIKQCPQGWRSKPPAAVANTHWFARLRTVKTDDIFAGFSENPTDVEQEKFLYYDGIFPQGKWLKIAVDDKRVVLSSLVKHPVFDVTVIDRRGDQPRIGRLAKLEAGTRDQTIEFQAIESSRFLSDAQHTLVDQLVAAGLHDDEARSLVDNWRRPMFETPGLHLFYRLPQEEYDARMPLTITPKPARTVRVGLIYHGHLEPDFAERILELVKRLDSENFAERDAAMKTLIRTGPAALAQIQKIRTRANLSVEVRERIDSLVKRWNARDGFDH